MKFVRMRRRAKNYKHLANLDFACYVNLTDRSIQSLEIFYLFILGYNKPSESEGEIRLYEVLGDLGPDVKHCTTLPPPDRSESQHSVNSTVIATGLFQLL